METTGGTENATSAFEPVGAQAARLHECVSTKKSRPSLKISDTVCVRLDAYERAACAPAGELFGKPKPFIIFLYVPKTPHKINR